MRFRRSGCWCRSDGAGSVARPLLTLTSSLPSAEAHPARFGSDDSREPALSDVEGRLSLRGSFSYGSSPKAPTPVVVPT